MTAPVFVERTRPPWLLAGLLAVALYVLSELLDLFPDEAWRSAAFALIIVGFFVVYLGLVVVRVEDGTLTWARRAGGPRIPVAGIVAAEVLTGPALREVRTQLTPSFRIHSPVWERVGVCLVVVTDGEPVTYLVTVRDIDGFLAALGRPSSAPG